MVLSHESGILIFSHSFVGGYGLGSHVEQRRMVTDPPTDPIKLSSSVFALYKLSSMLNQSSATDEDVHSGIRWMEKV
jgi:hypothetical protein